MKFVKFTSLAAVIAIGGCAADDPYMRTKTGAAIGAVAGGVIGHQLDDDAGRFVGAAAGAAIGGGIGYAMDRQHQQLRALADENERLGLEVQRLQDGSILVNMPGEVTFDLDSDRIRREFYPTLNRVADILNEDPRSIVRVIGHTDNTGDAAYNQDLSLRRAESVADYLSSQGVNYRRLSVEGRGERQPVASNRTAAGRQANRRVELIIRPYET